MANINEDYLDEYLNGYKEIIKLNFNHIKEHHDEAFPLLKYSNYLSYCILKFNDKQFFYETALLIVDNHNFEKLEYDFTDIEPSEYEKVVDFSNYERIEKFIEIKFPELVKHKIFIIEKFYSKIFSKDKGGLRAEKDYDNWRTENKTKVDSYNHETISPYSHLDYEGLIRSFNAKGFNDDFKYQMDQAEECYKRKLYLPAAATLSVALETVLIALCKRENIKIDNNTMLNYLGEELRNRNVINYRLAKRIDITYSLRNSLAHSNKGEVAKADCEIILNSIRTIIDNYF
ncbi:hypothetical protein [Macrococcoides caseolyticum]|uniref:DUF4145 domain-containing protein n=1 Tax=Macrococcus caseolyticus (strain JCSC5402) TaxID=458233 RepID=B9EBN6_MACCJ|nr:hypothetical protein [Macrococcus caseolyticus]BAH17647.1 conserved hypothetical protein [Macrococcus caseolyticus JCSC5402]